MVSDWPVLDTEREDSSFRDRILSVATTLFIRDGFNGVSFLDIGKALGTGHSRIHYYFRTKSVLAEAALDLYVARTTSDFQAIWTDLANSFAQRFVLSRDWVLRRYLASNPTGTGGRNWGLLARFAGEAEAISPTARRTLRRTLDEMDRFIGKGVALAVAAGELGPTTPQRVLMLQISGLLHNSLNLTRFGGDFGRIDDLLHWTLEVTIQAYGSGAARPWPPAALPQPEPTRESREPG